MKVVPLNPVASQNAQIVLASQACSIDVYTLSTGLYFDLTANGQTITTGVVCEDQARLLLDRQYLSFVGDFMFVDTQGDNDPVYTGLGARYLLIYLEVADLVDLV